MKSYSDKNILVVDDQETNQIVLDGILEYHYGISAHFAANGKEAVSMALEVAYDLIFMDINMPIMNGIEAAAAISAKYPKLPIVAVTTNTSDESRNECFTAGMVDYITKPIDIKIFENVMHRYLVHQKS